MSVLTVGSLVFSSDTRLAVLPGQPVGSWRLRIQDVVARDQGEYQCQVNTEPKESAVVQLIVRGRKLVGQKIKPAQVWTLSLQGGGKGCGVVS